MHGCPNRCRHCWLGNASGNHMDKDDLRWAAAQFRSYVRPGEDRPFIEKLQVFSWFREPDYSDDYERLYDLEKELSDGEPTRYELLSVWRLARDKKYAEWAKKIGPDTCQITFFGMGETQDWFHRRKGTFQDCVTATKRLLEVGMKPRWQFFLTKKIIPDLNGLIRLIDRMRIRERVQALGSEFVLFMHPPGFEGEGMKIVHLCASEDDLKLIPNEIVESTRKHFNKKKIWATEAEDISRFLTTDDGLRPAYSSAPKLFFFILPNWDVYSNMATLQPWWKLGNLKSDSVETILSKYENDRVPGLAANYSIPCRELALRYGNPNSRLVMNDQRGYWLEKYCEEQISKIESK